MDIEIKDITVRYGKNTVLENLCMTVKKNSFTALLGRNGCGKSTLISCLGGAIRYEGEITADGRDIRKLNRRERAKLISVTPQLLSKPHVTVRELVSFGRSPYTPLGGRLTAEDKKIISDAIEKARLTDIQDKYADRISGGELRRAYLGMCLAQDTPIIILDEATAYMDADNENAFLTMLRGMTDKTVLFAMHDINNAVRFADNIAIIRNKKCVFCGSAENAIKEKQIEKHFNLERFTAENGRIFFG